MSNTKHEQTEISNTDRINETLENTEDLRYLCLLAYGGVQHILFLCFALRFFVMSTLCCQFFWIVYF
jgi:hypothetical protein